MTPSGIAVIIPALDEEATVATVVRGAAAYGVVVVVDDGSIDATVALAEREGAVVLRHAANRGYDAALATGLTWCAGRGFDAVVTMDADGQHDPSMLGRMTDPIFAGEADVVLGERPSASRTSERIFGLYTRVRFGIRDPLCGMKAYTPAAVIRHHGTLRRPTIGTGIALACLREGGQASVVPITARPRRGSSRFGSGLRAEGRVLRALTCAIAADICHLARSRRSPCPGSPGRVTHSALGDR